MKCLLFTGIGGFDLKESSCCEWIHLRMFWDSVPRACKNSPETKFRDWILQTLTTCFLPIITNTNFSFTVYLYLW